VPAAYQVFFLPLALLHHKNQAVKRQLMKAGKAVKHWLIKACS
jgi:hypothetical protein